MMSRTGMLRRLVLTLLVATSAVSGVGIARPCIAAPRLNSTFLEGYYPADWATSDWNTLDANLRSASIGQIIIQYTAESDPDLLVTYYPPGTAMQSLGFTHSGSSDVMDLSLSRADANSLSIIVGLQLDESEWWTNAGNTTFLDKQLNIAQTLARDLVQKYGSHKSFAGWYIPFEVDNCQLQTLTDQRAFVDHYWGPLTKTLNTLKPGAPVYISPVFDSLPADGCGSLSAWTTEWKNLLQRMKSSSSYGSIDVITLQDGVGALLNQPSDLASWYSAVRTDISNYYSTAALWSNTEVYSDPNNPNPMFLKQVVTDMTNVQSYVSGYTSFSWAEYYNPQFVNAAYKATYLNYLSAGSVEANAPTAPGSLTAKAGASGSKRINLSWQAPNDDIGVVAYRINRNGATLTTLYSFGTAAPLTTYKDSGLSRGTKYTYQVLALDAAGNASALSNSASATAP
jgi:Domain of unknown function (DUF4434)/Domain of unknown function (DUF5109)